MASATAAGSASTRRLLGIGVLAAGGILAYQWWRQQQAGSSSPSSGGTAIAPGFTPAGGYTPSGAGMAPQGSGGSPYTSYAQPNQGGGAYGGYTQSQYQSGAYQSYGGSGYAGGGYSGGYTQQGGYAPYTNYAQPGQGGSYGGYQPSQGYQGGQQYQPGQGGQYQQPQQYQGGAGQSQPQGGGGAVSGFGTLTPGGFFSSDPNNLSVPRSIRTNNPGALNVASWIKSFPGYAGTTQPDSAGNVTAVFYTPEHGVAAWYHLLHDLYGFSGIVSISALTTRYSGGPNPSYSSAIAKGSGGQLSASGNVNLGAMSDVLALAHGMFYNEAGRPTPLHDNQILNGVQMWIAGSLPA